MLYYNIVDYIVCCIYHIVYIYIYREREMVISCRDLEWGRARGAKDTDVLGVLGARRYICMYIYIYIYIHTHTCVHTYICYIYIYICIHCSFIHSHSDSSASRGSPPGRSLLSHAVNDKPFGLQL